MERPRWRYIGCLMVMACLVFDATKSSFSQDGIDFNALPVKGRVTMIDLGAKKCIPCKMMAPILEKMEKKYEGKAAIVFIDA